MGLTGGGEHGGLRYGKREMNERAGLGMNNFVVDRVGLGSDIYWKGFFEYPI